MSQLPATIPVTTKALAKATDLELEPFIEFLFSFSDPLVLGTALQARGYGAAQEINALIDIVLDGESGPSAKLGAIAMLQARRQLALEQSGAVATAKFTERRGDSQVEVLRTQKVLSTVQRQMLNQSTSPREESNGQVIDAEATVLLPSDAGIPGDHHRPNPPTFDPAPDRSHGGPSPEDRTHPAENPAPVAGSQGSPESDGGDTGSSPAPGTDSGDLGQGDAPSTS
jgi:hypothetical protein